MSFVFRKLLTNSYLRICGNEDEPDVLYKRLEVEVRGHDAAVLKSYEWFAGYAAKLLGIELSRTSVPPVHKLRRRALKSAFAHGKHIVHYEFRTYFRVMEFARLTGSTADTFLEYIQRNLPEGVAMKVTKERIEPIPSHIRCSTVTRPTDNQETPGNVEDRQLENQK